MELGCASEPFRATLIKKSQIESLSDPSLLPRPPTPTLFPSQQANSSRATLQLKGHLISRAVGHFRAAFRLCIKTKSKSETIHMKRSSACRFIFMQIKVIFK